MRSRCTQRHARTPHNMWAQFSDTLGGRRLVIVSIAAISQKHGDRLAHVTSPKKKKNSQLVSVSCSFTLNSHPILPVHSQFSSGPTRAHDITHLARTPSRVHDASLCIACCPHLLQLRRQRASRPRPPRQPRQPRHRLPSRKLGPTSSPRVRSSTFLLHMRLSVLRAECHQRPPAVVPSTLSCMRPWQQT